MPRAFPAVPSLPKYLLFSSFSCYNADGEEIPEFAVPKLRHPPPTPSGNNLEPHDVGQYAVLDVVINFSLLHGPSHPAELFYCSTLHGYNAITITIPIS